MSVTALAGSVIAFGNTPGVSPDNPNAGTSLFFGGAGILDTRFPYTYKPGEGALRAVAGWLGSAGILTVAGVPYTKTVGAIAAAANVVAATPMTLVSAASTTSGVSIVASITNQSTGVADTNSGAGFVGIDTYSSCTASVSGSTLTVTAVTSPTLSIGQTILTAAGALTGVTAVGMTIIAFGTGTGGVGTYTLSGVAGTVASGTITLQTAGPPASLIPLGSLSSTLTSTPSLWNPQALISRAVAITAAAAASGTVVFTIKGFDIYGYPMIETITAAANTQTVGKKAFKYIKSVTPDTTDAQNYSVDTTDIMGFPIRSDFFGDVLINYSASLSPAVITANTGYTASVQTAPTATTGDVRGTYTLQTASSTNANRLMIRQTPEPYNVTSDAGLFGATQFSTGF
jgi:hypothetical protein